MQLKNEVSDARMLTMLDSVAFAAEVRKVPRSVVCITCLLSLTDMTWEQADIFLKQHRPHWYVRSKQ